MKTENKSKKTYPIRIPADVYEACEAEAAKRRKRTGKLVTWNQVLYEKVRKNS